MEGSRAEVPFLLSACPAAFEDSYTKPYTVMRGWCRELHQAAVCSENTSCKIRIWKSNLSAAAAQVFKSRLD